MATTFAALLYRSDEIPDRALSRGFAVALAGWDVPAPRLNLAALPGAPGWSAAFYSSGLPGGEDELEHAALLFEDALCPAVGVLDAAAEMGHPGATVLSLIYSEEIAHDDGWRFDKGGFERHFVREGDEGIERGVETPDSSDAGEVEIDWPEGESEAEERDAMERAIRAHRGSTFLSGVLGTPALPALMGGLFAIERRLDVRLVEPDPASIAEETRRLNRALRRVDGRGAFEVPASIAGVATPAAYEAFARTYDWADPADPEDLYRELSLGAIEGTMRFVREDDLEQADSEPGWGVVAKEGLYPLARLRSSALQGGGPGRMIAIGPDGERLWMVHILGALKLAGPTFGELLRYLSLGWSRRSDAEEDLIGALMLRARVRRGGD